MWVLALCIQKPSAMTHCHSWATSWSHRWNLYGQLCPALQQGPLPCTAPARSPIAIHEDTSPSQPLILGWQGVDPSNTAWTFPQLKKLWHLKKRARKFSQKYLLSVIFTPLPWTKTNALLRSTPSHSEDKCAAPTHSFEATFLLTLIDEIKVRVQILMYAALSRGKSEQFRSTSFNTYIGDCSMVETLLQSLCILWLSWTRRFSKYHEVYPVFSQAKGLRKRTLILTENILSSEATHF